MYIKMARLYVSENLTESIIFSLSLSKDALPHAEGGKRTGKHTDHTTRSTAANANSARTEHANTNRADPKLSTLTPHSKVTASKNKSLAVPYG